LCFYFNLPFSFCLLYFYPYAYYSSFTVFSLNFSTKFFEFFQNNSKKTVFCLIFHSKMQKKTFIKYNHSINVSFYIFSVYSSFFLRFSTPSKLIQPKPASNVPIKPSVCLCSLPV